MPMQINEPVLEERLKAVAATQPIPVSMRALTIAILKDAMARVRGSGDVSAWKTEPATALPRPLVPIKPTAEPVKPATIAEPDWTES